MPTLHPKNAAQKDRLLTAPHWLCMERARFYSEAHRETEGLHPSLRAAKAMQRVFAKMTVRIEPDELLVGNRSSKLIAPPIAPERGDFTFVFQHLFDDLKKFGYRIEPDDERVLFDELIPYWTGKTVRDAKIAAFEKHQLASQLNLSPREVRRKLRSFGAGSLVRLVVDDDRDGSLRARVLRGGRLAARLPRLLRAVRAGAGDNVKGRGRCTDTQAHIVLGHKNALHLGFSGIQAQALARRANAQTDGERAFLESVAMSCESMRAFSERFAIEATREAARTTDPERRGELQAIADTCRRVPWLPPRSFAEAVQSLWFTQNAAIISYGAGSGITPGRVDQLLYPYYRDDLARGVLTREHALRLLEELVIKLNNNVIIWPNIGGVKLNHLGSDVENITIGGLDANGDDATNDLSALFIEAITNTNLATTASFRVSQKSPKDFVRQVVAIHRKTNSPAFLNDETVIAAMVRDGYTVEDARQYCLVGCVEPSGNGDTYGATGGSKVYFPTALDMVFNRGRTTFFGNQDGVDTGDPSRMASFDDFLAAFYTQLSSLVVWVTEATNLRDAIWAERFHNPLISSTIDGCIDNARDMTAGGARYNFGSVGGGGLGTVIDSLCAIRTFVFEQKVVSMDELREALATDFRGREGLRQRLLTGPRFGNDVDAVDLLARDLVARFCAMVSARKTACGGHYKASLISYGLNVYEGALEPATPDGRRAGEPLSNSMSPSNGAERRGPTAAMNSLARIDHTHIGYGNSLNMRLPVGILKSDKGVESVAHLVRAYFDKGGFHVQFNSVDSATLRAAQARPQDYADLIVRVSGYSAYFTRMGRGIQDDIIARTEFASCH